MSQLEFLSLSQFDFFKVFSQFEFLSFVTIFFDHLNTLKTDQLSGQLFAILAIFFGEVAQFSHSLTRVRDFFCGEFV